MSCQDMDALGIYMSGEFPSKLDPFMNDDMKDLWDSDLDQVNYYVFNIVDRCFEIPTKIFTFNVYDIEHGPRSDSYVRPCAYTYA